MSRGRPTTPALARARGARAQIFFATRSGGTTLDVGEGGGNPFASALVELIADRRLSLRSLPGRLRRATLEKSGSRQAVEWTGTVQRRDWRFQGDGAGHRERREALVLVVSDYSGASPLRSLHGAARDERRVAAALAQCGFSVTQGIGSSRGELHAALSTFRRRSARADVAVVYSTGHGMEAAGQVYLLPGDYPTAAGFGPCQFRAHAVAVARLARAASAARVNLVFFAGCRTLAGRP